MEKLNIGGTAQQFSEKTPSHDLNWSRSFPSQLASSSSVAAVPVLCLL